MFPLVYVELGGPPFNISFLQRMIDCSLSGDTFVIFSQRHCFLVCYTPTIDLIEIVHVQSDALSNISGCFGRMYRHEFRLNKADWWLLYILPFRLANLYRSLFSQRPRWRGHTHVLQYVTLRVWKGYNKCRRHNLSYNDTDIYWYSPMIWYWPSLMRQNTAYICGQ